MMNSLYGKFCQHSGGAELTTVMPKDMRNKTVSRKLANFYVIEELEEEPAKTANFMWGAYITAYSRMYLYEGIVKVQNAGHEVLYCDTDSIFIKMMNDNMPLKMGEELGEWDNDRFIDIIVNTVKAYQMTSYDKWEAEFGSGLKMKKGIKATSEVEAMEKAKQADASVKSVHRSKKVACKGVPSAYMLDFLNKGEVVVRKPVKMKEAFIQKLKANVWHDVKKEMKSIYSKRNVASDGTTSSLVLNMKRNVDYSKYNSADAEGNN